MHLVSAIAGDVEVMHVEVLNDRQGALTLGGGEQAILQ